MIGLHIQSSRLSHIVLQFSLAQVACTVMLDPVESCGSKGERKSCVNIMGAAREGWRDLIAEAWRAISDLRLLYLAKSNGTRCSRPLLCQFQAFITSASGRNMIAGRCWAATGLRHPERYQCRTTR